MDPHNLIAFESYPFDNEPWNDGWHSITNPSHETFGDDGIIWSTAATFRISQDENGMPILESKVCKLKHQHSSHEKLMHLLSFREQCTKWKPTPREGLLLQRFPTQMLI